MDDRFVVEPCEYETISCFQSRAKKENSVLKPGQKFKTWFSIRYGRELVGVCGLHARGKVARIGGAWIDPAFRKMGAFSICHHTRFRWLLANTTTIEKVEACAVGPVDYYGLFGFEYVKTLRNGARLLVKPWDYDRERAYYSEERTLPGSS